MSGQSWNDIINQVNQLGSTYDLVRRNALTLLSQHTGRHTISYYSGWIQKPHLAREPAIDIGINDGDKNGFMAVIHGLADRKEKGLDLILHTPGGDMAATESLVDYLRHMFGTNIRAFVPQLSMSGGTIIACACKEIWMGKHSSIGPIDPQFGHLAATGILEEFERAAKEIKADKDKALVWQPILRQLDPGMLTECEKSITWAKDMTRHWLRSGMFEGEPDQEAKRKASKIVKALTKKNTTKAHNRHIDFVKAAAIGLNIKQLESDQPLQDAVLTLHHANIVSLEATPAYKIIECHSGKAYIQQARMGVQVQP